MSPVVVAITFTKVINLKSRQIYYYYIKISWCRNFRPSILSYIYPKEDSNSTYGCFRAFHPVKYLAKPLAFRLARIASILANSGDRYFWQALYFSARPFPSDTSTRNFDERRRQSGKIARVSKSWVWNRRCHRPRDNNPWLLASRFIFLVEEGVARERRLSNSRDSERKTAVAITPSPRLERIIRGTRVNVEQPLLRWSPANDFERIS